MVEWLAPVGIIILGRIIESQRRGRVASATLGSRCIELRSSADADTVFAKLLQVGGNFRVDDSDASKRILVLSSPTTLWSSGHLYPIHVRQDIIGSIVAIGIRSKSISIGIVRKTHAHERCAAELSQLLGLPSARVV
ncbi:MAG TPA: hypothetical protein VFD36_14710 [Kofleriaceae bacterium]|nr:hypothetical protein [Kofleriaceae bacterium]